MCWTYRCSSAADIHDGTLTRSTSPTMRAPTVRLRRLLRTTSTAIVTAASQLVGRRDHDAGVVDEQHGVAGDQAVAVDVEPAAAEVLRHAPEHVEAPLDGAD